MSARRAPSRPLPRLPLRDRLCVGLSAAATQPLPRPRPATRYGRRSGREQCAWTSPAPGHHGSRAATAGRLLQSRRAAADLGRPATVAPRHGGGHGRRLAAPRLPVPVARRRPLALTVTPAAQWRRVRSPVDTSRRSRAPLPSEPRQRGATGATCPPRHPRRPPIDSATLCVCADPSQPGGASQLRDGASAARRARAVKAP